MNKKLKTQSNNNVSIPPVKCVIKTTLLIDDNTFDRSDLHT